MSEAPHPPGVPRRGLRTGRLLMAAALLGGVMLASPEAAQLPPRGGARSGAVRGEPKSDAKTNVKSSEPVTVDADRMERFGKEGLVVFTGHVVARQGTSVQYADRMEVYLDEKGDRIVRTVSTGTVRIVTRDCRTGTAQRAEYFDLEQRLVLTGNARVWQEDNVVSGDTITIFLSQDRSVVQGGKQDRVKAVFHPRDQKTEDGKRPEDGGAPKSARATGSAPAPCVK